MKNVILAVIAVIAVGCNQVEGPPGATGAQGDVGAIGPQGPTGATGETGAAGSDGTVITVVQFCSGTPVYPSTFPEVGLCISNKLYAVYSTHGGFLTLVLPGKYLSNAVGSRCDFTVSDNCQVIR